MFDPIFRPTITQVNVQNAYEILQLLQTVFFNGWIVLIFFPHPNFHRKDKTFLCSLYHIFSWTKCSDSPFIYFFFTSVKLEAHLRLQIDTLKQSGISQVRSARDQDFLFRQNVVRTKRCDCVWIFSLRYAHVPQYPLFGAWFC